MDMEQDFMFIRFKGEARFVTRIRELLKTVCGWGSGSI